MPLNVTKSLDSWLFQQSHIERNMDSAAYDAAHPDDTLVMAGPARLSDLSAAGITAGAGDIGITASTSQASVPLLPIGMLQNISWQQSKPTQPLMAIGSGRSFFTSGKATTQWQAARLFVNGRNLLRVLYHNAKHLGIDVSKFDDPAASPGNPDSKFFANLDSELFYLPFGMACVFRNKAHDWVGAFYAELCMIASWGISVGAGQSVIMENVSGMADRLLPLDLSSAIAAPGVGRDTVDKIIGFASASDAQNANGIDTAYTGNNTASGVA